MADQNTTVPRGGQAGIETQVAQERRRELAIEHLLFNTIRYVQRQHPGLLDELRPVGIHRELMRAAAM